MIKNASVFRSDAVSLDGVVQVFATSPVCSASLELSGALREGFLRRSQALSLVFLYLSRSEPLNTQRGISPRNGRVSLPGRESPATAYAIQRTQFLSARQ